MVRVRVYDIFYKIYLGSPGKIQGLWVRVRVRVRVKVRVRVRVRVSFVRVGGRVRDIFRFKN